MRLQRGCATKRNLLVCWAAVVALVSAAPAAASIPPKQERLDAKRFARAWWASRTWNYGDGVANCSGVRFRWNSWHYDPNIRRSLAYVPFPSDCTIVFNAEANWARVPESGPGETTFLGEGWWRLCATAIHEWGHLRGMPYSLRNPPIHSWNRNSIMAVAEKLNTHAWWWPYFPGCRYEGDGVDYDE
jgi:hypothetical protein